MTETIKQNASGEGIAVSYLVVRLGANKVTVEHIFESEDEAHNRAIALAKLHRENHYTVLQAYFVPLGAIVS